MTKNVPMFIGAEPTFDPRNGHVLLAGASGTGKTRALISICLAKLRNPLTGLIVIDPDGDITPALTEYAANPLNGLGWRRIHVLRPASVTQCFSLPLLHVPDLNVVEAHKRSLRTQAVFESSMNFGAESFGPRLRKLFGLGTFTLALNLRPLCDLPNLFMHGADELRASLGTALPYEFLKNEWAVFDRLPDRVFLEYRDPLISRLIPIFSNPRIRRVFGPQAPVDIAHIMRNREVLLLDLSDLEHEESILVGKALFSLVYYEGLNRKPDVEPHVFCACDEVFDYLSPVMVRGFDRLRKRNVQMLVCLQRFAQAEKDADTDTAGALSALISGTRTKVTFRLELADDSDFAARTMFLGHVRFDEPKPGTERPVTVGHDRQIVRNRSHATNEAFHEATAVSEGHATAVSRGHSLSTTEADGESESDALGETSISGTSVGDASMSGTMTFDGTSVALSQVPFSGGLTMPEYTNQVTGNSGGTGLSSSASHSSAASESASQSSSHATSKSHLSSVSEAESWSKSKITSYATAHLEGTSRGTSDSEGEGESFVPVLEWLPSFYSLEEQMHRLAGELKTLALRECFIKIDNAPPIRARTADTPPAFKSLVFRRQMLPLFEAKLAQSPYLHRVADVDALMAPPRPPPLEDPAVEPETMPQPASLEAMTENFERLSTRKAKRPRTPPPSRGTRSLTVIDGGKGGDNDPETPSD